MAAALREKRRVVKDIEGREDCRVLQFLGAGGMGEVWLAEKVETGARFAIKTIKSPLSLEQSEALSREVQAVSRLDHPWIVRVAGLRQGDPPYVVAEYVDGLPLREALRGCKGAALVVAELFAKIADALAFAHERGVVHGDLKPDNVLIDGNLDPRILDFGLASLGATRTRETCPGGTRGYSPPEQRCGDGNVGPWSDTYSLCVMLKEVLDDVVRADGKVPAALERIVRIGLRARPSRRYTTASALASDLRRWLRIPWLHPAVRRRTVGIGAAILALTVAGYLGIRPANAIVGDLSAYAWRHRDEQDEVVAMLSEALRSPDAHTLCQALRTAGALFPGFFSPRFLELGRDESDVTATWALWCLAQNIRHGAVPLDRRKPVITLANDRLASADNGVRLMAMQLVAALGTGDYRQTLRRVRGPESDRRSALVALACSSKPDDRAYVLRQVEDKRDWDAARCLLEEQPEKAERIWNALLSGRSNGNTSLANSLDWMYHGYCTRHVSDQTRQRVCRLAEAAYASPNAPPRRRIHAVRVLGAFGTAHMDLHGASILEWLLDVVHHDESVDVACAATEAAARILGNGAEEHAVVRKAEECLATRLGNDCRLPFTEARVRAWSGLREAAQRLATDAVRRGFHNWAEIHDEPLSDDNELLTKLKRELRQHPSILRREVLVNGRSSQTGYRQLARAGAETENVRDLLHEGKNEIVIETGLCLSLAGFRSVRLTTTKG